MHVPISLTRVRAVFALLTLTVTLTLNISPAGALSDQQLHTLNNQVHYFNSEIDCGNQAGQNVTQINSGDNIDQLMTFLVNKHGLTIAQAAAITGNLMQESGGKIRPTATNPDSGAYGIAQWLGGRLTNLKNFPTDFPNEAGGTDYTTMTVQMNFLWYEITAGTEKNDGALQALRSDPFPPIDQMVFDWEDKFERAGEKLGDAPMTNRIKNANQILQLYGQGSITSPNATGAAVQSGCTSATSGATAGSGFLGDPGVAAVLAANAGNNGNPEVAQCTGYVKYELDKHFPPYHKAGDPGLGDGKDVTANLGNHFHVTVNTTPAVHAVFSMPINAHGHTGIVSAVAVNPDGSLKSITVEDYNWTPGAYGTRTWDASFVAQYHMTFAHTEIGWQ